jgi:hypothetical protein
MSRQFDEEPDPHQHIPRLAPRPGQTRSSQASRCHAHPKAGHKLQPQRPGNPIRRSWRGTTSRFRVDLQSREAHESQYDRPPRSSETQSESSDAGATHRSVETARQRSCAAGAHRGCPRPAAACRYPAAGLCSSHRPQKARSRLSSPQHIEKPPVCPVMACAPVSISCISPQS